MTFCPDGALWVGSINHGLARVDTATGNISGVGLPGGGQNVWAVACDRNSNLWISTDFAEIVRYDTRSGAFSMAPASLPELAHHVAWNIQIDDWSRPNPVVYFAMRSFTDGQGQLHPGGVVAFGGP
jgi:streptogramin lyase